MSLVVKIHLTERQQFLQFCFRFTFLILNSSNIKSIILFKIVYIICSYFHKNISTYLYLFLYKSHTFPFPLFSFPNSTLIFTQVSISPPGSLCTSGDSEPSSGGMTSPRIIPFLLIPGSSKQSQPQCGIFLPQNLDGLVTQLRPTKLEGRLDGEV